MRLHRDLDYETLVYNKLFKVTNYLNECFKHKRVPPPTIKPYSLSLNAVEFKYSSHRLKCIMDVTARIINKL